MELKQNKEAKPENTEKQAQETEVVQPAKQKEPTKKNVGKEKLAVILIRGQIGIRTGIKDTLYMLNLRKKHACVVLEKNKHTLGMIFKVKDYVAYGEIDEATLKEMMSKRGKKNNKYCALHPPRGGFARKGTKTSFTRKGALGYRGKKINDLIKRML